MFKNIMVYSYSTAILITIFLGWLGWNGDHIENFFNFLGIYKFSKENYDKSAEVALNLCTSFLGSICTVGAIQYFFEFTKHEKKDFLRFFGRKLLETDFKLVIADRKLKNDNSSNFVYPFHEQIFKSQPNKPPNPSNVCAWVAYDDLVVATSLGRLFGKLFNKELQITLDATIDHLCIFPTISVGLGFTYHTHQLLECGRFENKISIGWTHPTNPSTGEQEKFLTDIFSFDGHIYTKNNSSVRNIALIARIVGNNGYIHFICAGLYAHGTAAAGLFLAEKWHELLKLYDQENKNLDTTNLAVLIEHPNDFSQVVANVNQIKIVSDRYIFVDT